MAKENSHSVFQICRNEKLISPKDGKTIVGTARFLKPCVQTESQAVTVPNTPLLFEIFSQNLKQWPEKVDIKGWHIPQKRWKEWVDRMARKYGALWKLTGICDAILSSRYEIRCNKDLILGLVEFWCPETNTFVFPWGEATVSLEDVMILGGFPTLGESVRRPLEGNLVKIEEEMYMKHLIFSRTKSRKASHECWIKHFMEEEREYEQVAFLSLWLSRYVFPSLSETTVSKQVFPVAIHLSSKTRMALAPAVLASLYKNLTLLKNQAMSSREELTASGPLKLLQLWAFERFPSLGPSIPNTLKPGEPRAARFHRLNAKISLPLVRSVLRLPDDFRWRPYIADLKNWGHPSYYKETKFFAFDCSDADEALKSFARCLHTSMLVGVDCKEEYLPHRVAMQFGYDQDLPASFPVSSVLWENARFAVLPRSSQTCVSVRYFNWWTRSKLARQAALRDIKRNENSSSPSVLAKRNVEKCYHSNEFGVKKPKRFEIKVSPKAQPEGCCSSFANEYAAKTRTHTNRDHIDEPDYPMCSLRPAKISSQKIIKPHVSPPVQVERTKVNSKDQAVMCGLKSTNAGGSVQEEVMEDQLTIRGFLTRAKHNNEEIVMDGESEFPLGAQSPLSSTNEIETLAKMKANMKPGEVNIEISVKDQKAAILENISEGDTICCTLAVDIPTLSVSESQNVSTFIADKEDVKKTKAEVKQNAAEVTRYESSIGESKGVGGDDVKSKPGLKDVAEGSSTYDLPTLGPELEARIYRLEKLFAGLKEKRFCNK